MAVVMVDKDDNPVVAFETGPDDFRRIVQLASSGAGEPAKALTLTADRVP